MAKPAKRKWTRQETEDWLNKNHRWIYCNLEDANLFVRKRCYGINWAFNWGNPCSWVILAAFVLAMVLVGLLA